MHQSTTSSWQAMKRWKGNHRRIGHSGMKDLWGYK